MLVEVLWTHCVVNFSWGSGGEDCLIYIALVICGPVWVFPSSVMSNENMPFVL